MFAFRYLKRQVFPHFFLYIYLFTLERFMRLLLLLLVIWLEMLFLRFYDKIFINIYFFYLKSKMKAEMLAFRRFKGRCFRLFILLLILLPLISVNFTQMSKFCTSPILEMCKKCSFFCSSKIFFANLDNLRKYIKSKIHIYTTKEKIVSALHAVQEHYIISFVKVRFQRQ